MRCAHPAATAAAVALFSTVAAGCGTHPASPPEGWLTAAQTSAEYRTRSSSLDLPDGEIWPPSSARPQRADDGRPEYYQRGVGAIEAEVHWLCSWVIGIERDATLRPQAAREFKRVSFQSTVLSDNIDEGGRQFLSTAWQELRSGRDSATSQLQDIAGGTCGGSMS